jgi:hypothetical protein
VWRGLPHAQRSAHRVAHSCGVICAYSRSNRFHSRFSALVGFVISGLLR